MQTIQQAAAELATKMSAMLAAGPTFKVAEADALAKPLIERLIADGHLPNDDAFIEWAGFVEFQHFAVCHTSGDPMGDDWKESWFCVEPSTGKVIAC